MNCVSGVVSYGEYETLMEKCIFANGNEWLVTACRFISDEGFCHWRRPEDTHRNHYSEEEPPRKRPERSFLAKNSGNWFSDLMDDLNRFFYAILWLLNNREFHKKKRKKNDL